LIHQELGNIMTKAATVVRVNSVLSNALEQVRQLEARAAKCSLSDTGNWTNQNVIFTKSLRDMFPVAKLILKGALQRDECRGAHYKPEFESPGLSATEPVEKQKQAEEWCDRFAANTAKWLKSTISVNNKDNEPELTYEDVDTTLSPPKPRLYGMVGGELIEQVWKKRSDAKVAALGSHGNGAVSNTGTKVGAT
jgi:succinate dehydrogenase / fumarate reductase flavoprotein subunit